MTQQGEPVSLEHIMASELYPKKPLVSDDDTLQVPFPALCGESIEFLGRTADGLIALSNFRVFIRYEQSFANIPLGMIEMVECRDIFFLYVYCKDARSLRCVFSTNEASLDWFKRLSRAISPPQRLQDVFAFAFHAWCVDECASADSPDQQACYQLCQPDGYTYSFGKEVERLGFDLKKAWRISYVNEDFKVSGTYPSYHVVPSSISDKDLEKVAGFRSSRRFPSVVWRDMRSGAVIVRCSQPEVGWLGWRNTEDECLLQAISAACVLNDGLGHSNGTNNGLGTQTLSNGDAGGMALVKTNVDPGPRKMLIVDARSYAAAVANRAKGGGCECPEYYPNCEIQFMSLANIHSIRKSFQAVRSLCAAAPDQASWLSTLENTKWLQHIGGLLRAAITVVNAIDKEGRPVLVHCSDGWDRTPQIVALAELMLDPYYRSMEGFQVLVEREWLEFGHKFADRCGHGLGSEDSNERCPVFLQFLDAVHQLLRQFPCAFQFSEAFLVKLVQHTYSCLFGTFICNNAHQRHEERVVSQTSSVWALLKPTNAKFRNYLYNPVPQQVLRPSCHLRHLKFWSSVYLSDAAPAASTTSEEPVEPLSSDETLDEDSGVSEQTLLPKTRSCDDIVAAVEASAPVMTRRLSDPSISTDTDPSQLLKEEIAFAENSNSLDERLQMGPDRVKFTNQSSETSLPNGECGPEVTDKQTQLDSSEHNNGLEINESVVNHTEEEEVQEVAENVRDRTEGLCNGNVLRENAVESSTDTLTEDLEHALVASADQAPKHTNCLVNGVDANSPEMDKANQYRLAPCEEGLNPKEKEIVPPNGRKIPREINSLLSMEKSASIATSTTDISDSHVYNHKHFLACVNGQLKLEGLAHLKMDSSTLSQSSALAGTAVETPLSIRTPDTVIGHNNSKASHSSAGSDTPGSCQSNTPSSTSPPTPGAESKGPWRWRSSSSLAKQLDCDGLTTWTETSQLRLAQLESDYHARIEQLQRQLHMAKIAICHYAAGFNGNGTHLPDNKDEILSLPESLESGEHASVGGCSTAASDVSWEQVEEKEARMTLWVPDHAVTHCAGCDMEFWIVRRKHHCRNCGKVFCGECTNFAVPVPQQYLNQPVRVCRQCFTSLCGDLSGLTSMVSSELDILDNLVANGDAN